MLGVPSPILIAFSVLLAFSLTHALQASNFNGASKAFGTFLLIFSGLTVMFDLAFFGYCIWRFGWPAAIALIGAGVAAKFVSSLFRASPASLLVATLSGFAVIPVCAGFLIFESMT